MSQNLNTSEAQDFSGNSPTHHQSGGNSSGESTPAPEVVKPLILHKGSVVSLTRPRQKSIFFILA